MFKIIYNRFLNFLNKRKLKNYIAIYAPDKGNLLCVPVRIYKKGDFVDSSYTGKRFITRSVIEGLKAAINGTSAINLMFLDRDDKMRLYIRNLYKSILNGREELILDYPV